MEIPKTGLQLRSLIKESGEIELSLAEVAVPEPGPDEIVVRVEASPINPSDLGLLLGPADMATLAAAGTEERPVVTARIPEGAMRAMAPRIGLSLPVGNEGAGLVVRAGSSEPAQALLGRRVSGLGGEMYAQFRCLNVAQVMALPDGVSAREGASCFVNPLTALGMTETMRMEGHKALVHTAAASNLGQMLVRICQADGIGLVNIVRSAEQEALLRGIGAAHVVNSSAPGFEDALTDALAATGATLGFDAIGGGALAGKILMAMEAAASRAAAGYSRYGSSVHKQVYIYGRLDVAPTVLPPGVGMAWGVGGWLLTPFLQKIGSEGRARLRARVLSELKTTFASAYTDEISLREALKPAVIQAYYRRATGKKYLINPTLSAH